MTALSLNCWMRPNRPGSQSFDSLNNLKPTKNSDYFTTATALFSAIYMRIIYSKLSSTGASALLAESGYTTRKGLSCCIDLILNKKEINHAKIKNQCCQVPYIIR